MKYKLKPWAVQNENDGADSFGPTYIVAQKRPGHRIENTFGQELV
ncbi:hypothetical protein R3X28_12440 [Maribacter sp. TH_r10]|nr:hypothetical protein [Maribacter sp. TH_r10]MDV7139693.1 hypothetical protein [Maribacter sp. TH_r10]